MVFIDLLANLTWSLPMQANDAGKNFKSEMGKRVKAELLLVWRGPGMLYNVLGKFDQEASNSIMQGI